ncbi:MAG: septum formation initiator family protein [Patescibacteria group bacterium]
MKNINRTTLRRTYYHVRHNYFTTNNLVVLIGLFVAASWVWGSVQAMERNYDLQKEIDYKQRELRLAELETQKLQFEQNYFKSDEYKELAVREKLGLINPGEKVLILPPNTEAASADEKKAAGDTPRAVPESNFQAWINFLFGGAYRSLQR